MTSTHKSGAILEGSDVLLECVVRANPSVRDVWWRHNGKLMDRTRDSSLDVVFGNQSLRLLRIRRTMGGTYQCLASNTQGQGESNQLQLQIKCTFQGGSLCILECGHLQMDNPNNCYEEQCQNMVEQVGRRCSDLQVKVFCCSKELNRALRDAFQ